MQFQSLDRFHLFFAKSALDQRSGVNFIVVLTIGSNIFSFEILIAKFAFIWFFIIVMMLDSSRLKNGKIVHLKNVCKDGCTIDYFKG